MLRNFPERVYVEGGVLSATVTQPAHYDHETRFFTADANLFGCHRREAEKNAITTQALSNLTCVWVQASSLVCTRRQQNNNLLDAKQNTRHKHKTPPPRNGDNLRKNIHTLLKSTEKTGLHREPPTQQQQTNNTHTHTATKLSQHVCRKKHYHQEARRAAKPSRGVRVFQNTAICPPPPPPHKTRSIRYRHKSHPSAPPSK